MFFGIRTRFTLLIVLFSISCHGSEICDNGIDDNLDGNIDLNDESCVCQGLDENNFSLIPNPSFEEHTCCSRSFSCAKDWIQATSQTSDYHHKCGTSFLDSLQVPRGGEAVVGFWISGTGFEAVGTCLNSPMIANKKYRINLWIALQWSNSLLRRSLDLAIYGTRDCSNLPINGWNCPGTYPDWEMFGSVMVEYPQDKIFYNIDLDFETTYDVEAIILTGNCDTEYGRPFAYFFIDELTLREASSFTEFTVTENGAACSGDKELEAFIDESGGTWQWYKDNVALAGETSQFLDVSSSLSGFYTAKYTLNGRCETKSYQLS